MFIIVSFAFLIQLVSSLSQDDIVNYVNRNREQGKSTWEAKKYPFSYPDSNFDHAIDHFPVKENSEFGFLTNLYQSNFRRTFLEVPDIFDARFKWSHCDTVWEIYDQGNCGSCWAVAVASAISDRICIKHPNNGSVRISARTALNCIGEGCSKCFLKDVLKIVLAKDVTRENILPQLKL